MLLAHRRRKLRRADEDGAVRDIVAWNEDLITSYVFGLLRYLPADRGLSRVLQSALPVLPLSRSIEVSAWPPDGDVEPDALLLADAFACVVEAKWEAPFGPQQLGREWLWLRKEQPKLFRTMLIVTRYRVSSGEVFHLLEKDLRALGVPELVPEPSQIGVLTWTSLATVALNTVTDAPHEAAIIADLRWVFESCGALREPFDGWNLTAPSLALERAPTWYAGEDRRYWTGLAAAAPAAWRRPLDPTSFFSWVTR
ncbi:hypothetical protein [Sorangium cellulosum]|uniref:hypothetical protein n=1 Tax=Sorangium cellulosum TaxID=56 RepID=UPI000325D45E|nr:hypothetical protein [Sorangium cellulosum]